MAGYSSTFYGKAIIDQSTNVNPWTPPRTLYVALTTVVLTRTDTTVPPGVELVGLGYARTAIANDVTFWSPAALDIETGKMTTSNIVAVTFPNATSDWPPVPGWAITDDPIAGNVYWSGPFSDTAGLVTSGQTPVISVGELQIVVSGA